MPSLTLECILMLGYAALLALIAFLLESVSSLAHRRTGNFRTAGFKYHSGQDIWRCPEDQHLFPVFSDPARGVVVYRASAPVCNACRSKPVCTDSNQGREIERRIVPGLEYGVMRFHRGISLMLLVLASLILIVELLRSEGLYPRLILISALAVFCSVIVRLSLKMSQSVRDSLSG
jgi:hypothetical protein